ncbi:MAG: DUF484 family protein [Rhodospirillales bacterium]|nr:DUF484 family protein [Rhodospirillales bacterium]
MVKNIDDTAQNKTDESDESFLSVEQVAGYLLDNPDFLADNPDILKSLTPPARWSGDGVVDMQHFLMDRLRSEIDNLRECTQGLIETSRNNMTNQTRAHTAVLALLSAGSFENMIRIITDDLPLILDVDVVSIGYEVTDKPDERLVSSNLRRFGEGAADSLLGLGEDFILLGDAIDDGILFGSASGLVHSAAITRLRPGLTTPTGLLALGSRGQGVFHPGQGTELLTFMTRIVERCAHNWLENPVE